MSDMGRLAQLAANPQDTTREEIYLAVELLVAGTLVAHGDTAVGVPADVALEAGSQRLVRLRGRQVLLERQSRHVTARLGCWEWGLLILRLLNNYTKSIFSPSLTVIIAFLMPDTIPLLPRTKTRFDGRLIMATLTGVTL